MSEVKAAETKVEAPVEEVVEKEVVVSPVEAEARDQGWVSKEEWVESGRSEDEWRPAKEFVDRGELYRSLHSIKRELKQTQAAHTALQRHHAHVFEKAKSTALAELRAEKRMAIRAGDMEALEEAETAIENFQEETAKERQELVQVQQIAQTAAAANPQFDAFLQRNPWYITDADLRDEADAASVIYLNKGLPKDGMVDHVEKTIRKKFPDKFPVKKTAPSPVASGDRSNRSVRKDDTELDELETDIMNRLVSAGELTAAQYKAELRRAKGIK